MNDGKDDLRCQKKNRGVDQEDTRKVEQRPRRTKEQTQMNKTMTEMKITQEGINSKITEAEQISDLENRIVEISAVEQNREKTMKKI